MATTLSISHVPAHFVMWLCRFFHTGVKLISLPRERGLAKWLALTNRHGGTGYYGASGLGLKGPLLPPDLVLVLSQDHYASLRSPAWDFPGGPVDKNPPASAENTGSIPGPGRSHMLQSS